MNPKTITSGQVKTPRAQRSATHPAHSPPRDLSLLAPLRILANFSVVAHHMRGDDVFFGVRFGMFLFLAMMFALNAGSQSAEPLRLFGRRKFVSLMMPWLRWSLLYVALAAVVGLVREGGIAARLEPWMLTAGGHASLWFLPFAFCALMAWKLAAPLLVRIDPFRLAMHAAVLGLGLQVAVSFRLDMQAPPLPWDAWLHASPLILWGLALGQARRLDDRRRRFVLLIVPALAMLGWLAEPLIGFHEDMGRRIAVVMVLLALGLAFSPRMPRFVAWLGTLTYGIYLAHPFVAKSLTEVIDPFAWNVWTHAVVVWLLSAALILLLRRLGLKGAEIQRRLTAA